MSRSGVAHSATPADGRPPGPHQGRRAPARVRPDRVSSKVIVTGNIDRVELWSDAVYREVAERGRPRWRPRTEP